MSDNPFVKPITGMDMVTPQPDASGGMTMVVLDRIEPGVTPDYCVHGKVTCYGPCGEWLWLGSETYELVRSGRATGVCQSCAAAWFEKAGGRPKPLGNVRDHRRADGPHT